MATTAATITASTTPVPTSPAASHPALAISTISLTLSLVSLAGFTLFRNLFESAEGYKKCGEPSIGQWSRMTWREWRWFELRFATHFIAPKISIHPRLDDIAIRGDGVSSLRHAKPLISADHSSTWRPTSQWSRELALDLCKEILEETLSLEDGANAELDLESQNHRSSNTFPIENKVSWLPLIRALYDLAISHDEQMHSVPTEHDLAGETPSAQESAAGGTASDGVPPAVQSTNVPSTQHSSPGIAPAEGPSTSHSPPKLSTTQTPTTSVPPAAAASTVSLPGHPSTGASGTVPSLHSTSQTSSTYSLLGVKQTAASPTVNQQAQASSTKVLSPDAASNENSIAPDRLQTEFAISFLEWTWDIMPKEATRPMAKTTLGELINLGFRLGMEWRVDLSKNSFVAHGQGYGLVCTLQGDMGLVATFTRDDWHGRKRACPKLIPNRATDKLMCGIIPVSREIVGDDIYCTSDEGEVDVLPAIIDRLKSTISGAQRTQLERSIRDGLLGSEKSSIISGQHTNARAMLGNQAAALICEFSPLPEVSSAQLHYFPGWTSSLGALKYSAFGSPHKWLESLKKIQDEFSHQTLADFTSDRTMSLVTSAIHDLMKVATDLGRIASNEAKHDAYMRMRSISVCQKVFDDISNWFREELNSQAHVERTDYTCLVAAHCFMGIEYINEKTRTRYPLTLESVSSEESFTSEFYAACFRDLDSWCKKGQGRFGDYIMGRWCAPDKISRSFREHTPMAWVLIFLKGLAWSMSTTGMAMGEPVPSSCLDHPRNVWIL